MKKAFLLLSLVLVATCHLHAQIEPTAGTWKIMRYSQAITSSKKFSSIQVPTVSQASPFLSIPILFANFL
jgi:hypothetical protein